MCTPTHTHSVHNKTKQVFDVLALALANTRMNMCAHPHMRFHITGCEAYSFTTDGYVRTNLGAHTQYKSAECLVSSNLLATQWNRCYPGRQVLFTNHATRPCTSIDSTSTNSPLHKSHSISLHLDRLHTYQQSSSQITYFLLYSTSTNSPLHKSHISLHLDSTPTNNPLHKSHIFYLIPHLPTILFTNHTFST